MTTEVKVINLGGVNCYLLGSSDSFVLVDTGIANKRSQLVKELENAGCRPGHLKLIVLTHGDIDHVANAAYLRDRYAASIAMHLDDAGMVEKGDMSWNRKAKPDQISFIGRMVIALGTVATFFAGSNNFEQFKPDIYLTDGQSLSEYGLDASVIHIPGHSKGSIGILTANGDLFCGDLLWNMRKPGPHFIVVDLDDYTASVQKLKSLDIRTIYPGHGSPFAREQFFK